MKSISFYLHAMRRNVGIFLFKDFETLDFAGPHEVFSVADELSGFERFNVFSFAEDAAPVKSIHGVSVNPDFGFESLPSVDVLVIPGGEGTHTIVQRPEAMDFLNLLYDRVNYVMTVCTGAMIAAKLGWLKHKQYCTHALNYDILATMEPDALPMKNLRFTGDGKIHSSAGVTAGIDLSVYLVRLLAGDQLASQTARYLEMDGSLLN